MASFEIAPALKPGEWEDRRRGAISRDAIDLAGGEYVVIEDASGATAMVSGADALFALIALANDALPDGDPRKLSTDMVRDLDIAAEELRIIGNSALSRCMAHIGDVVRALVPPT